MRHWFVPACLCLVTWSGATSSDSKLSLEGFSGVSIVDKKPDGSNSEIESSLAAAENLISPDRMPTTVRLPDIQIDIPVQIGGEPELKIERTPFPPVRQPVLQRSNREVCDVLAKAAQSNDLPIPFFIRLLFQESEFKPDVVSSTGAQGVAQFMPETAADMGLVNPFDPLQAIPASARLLRKLIAQFGNLGLAAAAYNAGPKRIQAWLTKKDKLPQETQGYVKIITGRPAETWMVADAGHPEIKLPRRAPCQEMVGLLAWNGPRLIPMPRSSPFARTWSVPMRPAVQATVSVVNVRRSAAISAAILRVKTPGNAVLARDPKGTNQMTVRKQPVIEAKLANKLRRHNKTARKPLELAAVAGSTQK